MLFIQKILLVILIVLIIKSLIKSFTSNNKNFKKNNSGSSDNIIDVDYEEVDWKQYKLQSMVVLMYLNVLILMSPLVLMIKLK